MNFSSFGAHYIRTHIKAICRFALTDTEGIQVPLYISPGF